MDTMKVIYKILEVLEKAMDEEHFKWKAISHEQYGISQEKWIKIIEIMKQEGFIEGIDITRGLEGNMEVVAPRMKITFKGLVYLAENSNAAKIINAAKLIKDIVPLA